MFSVVGYECMVDVRAQSGGSPGPFWRKTCLSPPAVAIVGVCGPHWQLRAIHKEVCENTDPARFSLAEKTQLGTIHFPLQHNVNHI